jgi:hypothetical protein
MHPAAAQPPRAPFANAIRLLGMAALAVVVASGCKTFTATRDLTPAQKAAQAAFWEPHLLYLAPWPYPKLHVEVDAIEGAEPDAAQLETLRAFLERVCDKPGGVTLALDDVIPADAARGRSSHSLALEHFDGAPDAFTAPLYVLFHDSRVTADALADPYFTSLPFPGLIVVDARVRPFASANLGDAAARILQHEAGHALGLARNTAHSDGVHCTNTPCLMNANYQIQFDVLKLRYRSRLPDFCGDCLADLRAGRGAAPPKNLRFTGAALVREEDEYLVAALPGMVYVHFKNAGPLTARMVSARRAQALRFEPQPAPKVTLRWTSPFSGGDAERLAAALRSDPMQPVRELAEMLRQQMEKSKQTPMKEQSQGGAGR